MAEEGEYYQGDSLGMDIEPEMDSSMVEGVNEFEPAIVPPHPTTTRHGEYEKLELLGEVYHIASGGDASTTRQDSSILKEFKSPMENTVLHVAALYGNDEMVDRVAQQDPDLIFSFNINHDTPLHFAARAGHISTLRKLLDAGANSNVTRLLNLMKEFNNQGNIMLHEAMMSGGSMRSMIFHVLEACSTTVEARLMANTDIRSWSQFCYELALNNVNNEGQSVLYMAAEAGLMEAVNRILEKCPESAMPKGIPPLVAAIMKRDKGNYLKEKRY